MKNDLILVGIMLVDAILYLVVMTLAAVVAGFVVAAIASIFMQTNIVEVYFGFLETLTEELLTWHKS